MTELERITEIAKGVGGTPVMKEHYADMYDCEPEKVCLSHIELSAEQLLAFEQAILAKRDEEIDNLKTQLAMQADAIDETINGLENGVIITTKLHKIGNATAEAVAKWAAARKLVIEKRVLEEEFGEPIAYVTYKGILLHAGDPKVLGHSNPEPLYRRKEIANGKVE